MAEKQKEEKSVSTSTGGKGKAPKPKRVRKHPSELVKRGEDGAKLMKVARGTERARRRTGIKKGWRMIANAQKMQPTKDELAYIALHGEPEDQTASHSILSKQKAA